MTEHEKRIEEMAQVMCDSDICCRDCVKCTIYDGKHCCIHLHNAMDIYDAGYRKADEVKKETAKEILQEIASVFYAVGNVFELTRHDIQELAEHYGVEVEE